jgi:glutathione S-transferase
MQLIGMLDSPYVRRVAISLQLLGLPFEHRSVSVFRGFDEFRRLNPVVKAPTFVCDDGTVLMDSGLIIEHAEAIAAPGRSLMPAAPEARRLALRRIGLALAACEKAVQIVYEGMVRPPEKRHEPWLERVRGQLAAAWSLLEAEAERPPLLGPDGRIDQAGISAAVTWRFTQQMLPGLVDPARHPALRDFSAAAEDLPAFRAAPHGAGTYPAGSPAPGA